ncbi:hypothetical protein PAHAL_6G231000 [Panicum hallii]|uniref:RING-type E3 ubiquitin transferase n=2 Tax=Panicum hallii TaxID=206008 RepID=A0A2T8IHA1_9POAL|nr:hypothetical protein PAHAL_6G231000 [Panicum hallii]
MSHFAEAGGAPLGLPGPEFNAAAPCVAPAASSGPRGAEREGAPRAEARRSRNKSPAPETSRGKGMPRRRRPGGGTEGGGPEAGGQAPTMSASASASAPSPSPPAGEPPSPPPPPVPGLFYCYECGRTADRHGPLPAPPSSPHRVCPSCCRGFLEENPPPPPSPPPPPPFPGSVSVSGSGSSSSSELSDDDDDDDVDLLSTDYDSAREFIRRFVGHGPHEGPLVGDFAAVAAMSALRDHPHRPGEGAAVLHRHLGLPLAPAAARGGEPPASAASIAALPTVEVAEPAAACAICKDDLPLASQARKLPCAHLYHSSCIVTWLEMHNSCPVCRFRIPFPEGAAPSEQDSPPTRITIRFSTTTRRRGRVHAGAAVAAPVSASPTQLAQAVTGDGAGGPANSGETVSSEWPPHPESDAVMSEAREGDGFFD